MNLNHLKYSLCILCTAFFLTGCTSSPSPSGESENTWTDSGFITVGNTLTVQNTDNRLNLLNNIDALSADGLYYASWTMGSPEPYENSDGDTVDLYDVQIYLLLGEFPNSDDARDAMGKWLAAGKTNYEILTEEEITCNGQSYAFISYNCIHDDNPYARGVSAFGTRGGNAVCIELTCRENFEEDLKTIMIHFLDGCSYSK